MLEPRIVVMTAVTPTEKPMTRLSVSNRHANCIFSFISDSWRDSCHRQRVILLHGTMLNRPKKPIVFRDLPTLRKDFLERTRASQSRPNRLGQRKIGNLLADMLHCLALFVIGAILVWPLANEYLKMKAKAYAEFKDIQLRFIYFELGG